MLSVGRRGWEGAQSLPAEGGGRVPSTGFALLERVSVVGLGNPWLTRQWEEASRGS